MEQSRPLCISLGKGRGVGIMKILKMTCSGCRNGCLMTVETEDGEVLDVDGNGCMRGYAYAQRKVSHPENQPEEQSK